jgi:hypothetical protein
MEVVRVEDGQRHLGLIPLSSLGTLEQRDVRRIHSSPLMGEEVRGTSSGEGDKVRKN